MRRATFLRFHVGRSRHVARARTIVMSKIFAHVRSAFCAALVILAFVGMTEAAGTPEQRHACRHDAFKFCRNEIPDVPRITACMEKNLKKLSPACRAQFK